MLYLLLFVTYLLAIQSLHSAQLAPKRLVRSINAKSTPNTGKQTTYSQLVAMFDSKNKQLVDHVKHFLENQNNNPNQQDDSRKNTLLQRAILIHNESVVKLLVADPRVDSSILNANRLTAYQCISKEQAICQKELHQIVQLRDRLDKMINAMIITDTELMNHTCKDEQISSKINSLLLRIIPDTILVGGDVLFISSIIGNRITNKLPLLQKLHSKYQAHPNYQDLQGTTQLHLAAYLHDPVMIQKLIKNPDIDTKQNNENLFPHDFIFSFPQCFLFMKEKNSTYNSLKEIYSLLFVRHLLEKVVFTAAEKNDYTHKLSTEIFIEIKNNFKKLITQQENNSLLTKTEFPSYADHTFLDKMLQRYFSMLIFSHK